MSWEFAEPDPQWPDADHVVLRFVKYPNHSIHVYSHDVGAYLRGLDEATVSVVFDEWYGCTPSFNEVAIGALTRWKRSRDNSYEVIGSAEPSPWVHSSCRFLWW
jgi:hypothetical protein